MHFLVMYDSVRCAQKIIWHNFKDIFQSLSRPHIKNKICRICKFIAKSLLF